MKKFAKLTALLVVAAMLSVLCAFPGAADATTLNERFVETFDYAKGTVSSIASIAATNKYSTSVGGEIIDNPYDSSLGTSMKWASGDWRSQWSYSSGAMIKLSAPKMVISLKAALPEAGAGFGLKIAPRYEGDADNFSQDRGTGDILRIGSNAETGAITATTGGPRTSLGTLEYGKMHEFTVVITNPDDAETLATYDVYVDGVLKASGINYYTGTYGPASGETYGPFNVDGIRFIQGNGGGAIMDDIRVYAATASDITSSSPENGASNISVYTNSINVQFETDVTLDQMTTSNVSVSNATVSSIDRINNRNYKINLANTLTSKTEYVVSFGNATDVLGNAITDTITFTSVDAGFVPTKVVGFTDDYSSYEAGTYTKVSELGAKYCNNGAAIEIKNNTVDSSLGQSIYVTTQGDVQTQWDSTQPDYIGLIADKIVLDFKVSFASTTPVISSFVTGGRDVGATTTEGKAQILRTNGNAVVSGYTRQTILSSVEANKMYNFTYVFTTGAAGTAKYDIYVDGVLKVSDMKFSQTYYGAGYELPMYSLNHVNLTLGAGCYFDDLTVYSADGMAVESTLPADGDAAVQLEGYITVKTSTPINFADTSAVALSNLGNVTRVEKVDGYTAKIYYDGETQPETQYTTRITGLKDLLGFNQVAKEITFTTGKFIPYEVSTVAFTQNGNAVTASVNVKNNDTAALNAALIVAVYKGEMLVASNWVTDSVASKDNKPLSATVSFTPATGLTAADYTVKAYVWEDVSATNIAPMTDATPFTLVAAN